MHVVATAGHVDHGKSTLVRALTGIEPDRWAEERRRGLTIDLGYAWTSLPGAGDVAFVDVPGHRRFIGNMLAGLGPSPAVLLVVAADEGWRAQTEEHLRAVEALQLEHGLVVVTRADLADPGPAMDAARQRVAEGSLGRRGTDVPAVAVSAVTGQGMDELRRALDDLCGSLPRPSTDGRVRLWVDRSFTVRGSGTVVTGTLQSGSISVGDTLTLAHRSVDGTGTTAVTVRGLQSLGRREQRVQAPARVAVNLRGVPVDAVSRGDALLTVGAWPLTEQLDVRLDAPADTLPAHLTLHVGAADLPVRLRPLVDHAARLTLPRGLPLQAGDRAILRQPGVEGALTGLAVADVAPPRLTRRGAGARRGEQLLAEADHLDEGSPAERLAAEVHRRGHLTLQDARLLGFDDDDLSLAGIDSPRPGTPAPPAGTPAPPAGTPAPPAGTPAPPAGSPAPPPALDSSPLVADVVRAGDHLVSPTVWGAWRGALVDAVRQRADAEPLDPFLPVAAARDLARLPDLRVVETLAADAGLQVERGRVSAPGTRPSLGEAQPALDRILARLAQEPFAAPEAHELRDLGLGPRQIAAAVATGQLIRVGDDVLLLPKGPAVAMSVLAGLPQPFTTSEARQALGTSRRVAIPLLEHLDSRGWTRRVDAGHREIVR